MDPVTLGMARADATRRHARAGHLPAGLVAARGVNVWDDKASAYNVTADNTRRLRWSLGRALSGVGIARWAFCGDSTVAGYATTGNNSQATQAWPVQLRNMLAAKGYPVYGSGPVVANPGGAVAAMVDPRWVYVGAWTAQGGGSTSYNFVKTAAATGATATFTSLNTGTVVRLAHFSSADIKYSLDGGGLVTVGASVGSTMTYTTITGLANTVHSIQIVTQSTSNVSLAYAEVCGDTTGYGLSFANFGVNSTRAANWTDSTYYYPGSLALAWLPHVTFIDLGINDKNIGAGVPVATFKASYQTLITSFRQGNASNVILMTSNPNQTGDFSDYQQAKYELADENDLPLIDIASRWKDYAAATQAGLTADGAHPSPEGYADKAAAIFVGLGL